MFEKYLQELGLSDKEASVYISLLQVDNDSVLDLSKKTKINRTTIYPVLESLAKKGLISEAQVDKKIRYHAEPPERLETYVERQKTMLQEHSNRLKDVIPQLKSIQRETGEKPMVKYFEGRQGAISSLEEFYNSIGKGGTAYLIYPKDAIKNIFNEKEIEKYRSIRLKREIKTKVISTSSKNDIISDSTGNRIQIDGEKYPITSDIAIYEDKVRVTILGKSLAAFSIKSQDLADTLRSLFDLVFDLSKNK